MFPSTKIPSRENGSKEKEKTFSKLLLLSKSSFGEQKVTFNSFGIEEFRPFYSLIKIVLNFFSKKNNRKIEEKEKEQQLKSNHDYLGWFKLKIKNELNKNGIVNRKKTIIMNKEEYPLLFDILVGTELIFPTTVLSESSFSLLKYIKTDLRNLMSDETLDSIMRIKYATETEINRIIFKIIRIN